MEDWGHEKRSKGLKRATGDWLGWFNDDDSYANDYLEKMLAVSKDQDVVYCAWNKIPECVWGLGSSTSGNFIILREVAQSVGYSYRNYEADGWFIAEVIRWKGRGTASNPLKITRVDEILYFHNEQ
jgi:hypothetical protein